MSLSGFVLITISCLVVHIEFKSQRRVCRTPIFKLVTIKNSHEQDTEYDDQQSSGQQILQRREVAPHGCVVAGNEPLTESSSVRSTRRGIAAVPGSVYLHTISWPGFGYYHLILSGQEHGWRQIYGL